MKQADPATVVTALRRDVGRRAQGRLAPEAVEAVDVVNHALAYTRHPRGRHVWREVVRSGAISPEAEDAVVSMVHRLNQAVEAGDAGQVLQICDCLGAIFDVETP